MFKRAKVQSTKPDKQGKVVVKIFRPLNDLNLTSPDINNRREDIVLESTTVGEVFEAIEKLLKE